MSEVLISSVVVKDTSSSNPMIVEEAPTIGVQISTSVS